MIDRLTYGFALFCRAIPDLSRENFERRDGDKGDHTHQDDVLNQVGSASVLDPLGHDDGVYLQTEVHAGKIGKPCYFS